MNLSKTKNVLNKAWCLVKKYWYLVTLVVVLVVLMIVFRTPRGQNKFVDSILNIWFKAIERNDSRLRELDNVRTTGNNQEGTIRSQYGHDEDSINTRHEQGQQEIKTEGTANANNIAQQTKDDPEAMTDAFMEAFGIPRKD